ncbi:hypothetical protein GCM10023083_19360 [Streptomyces phyllanthi]
MVSAGEYAEVGSFGDVLANACVAAGLGGLVTDTGVRDTRELRELGFPVGGGCRAGHELVAARSSRPDTADTGAV